MRISLFAALFVLIACGRSDNGAASRYAVAAASFYGIDFDQSYALVRIPSSGSTAGTLHMSREGDRSTLELTLDEPSPYRVRVQFSGIDSEEVCIGLATTDQMCRTVPQEYDSNPLTRGEPGRVLNSRIREIGVGDLPLRDSVCFRMVPNDDAKREYAWRDCYSLTSKALQYTDGVGAFRFIGALSYEVERAFPGSDRSALDLAGLGLLAENQ